MEYVKVKRISQMDEKNPFLISWLRGGKSLEFLIVKRKGEKVSIYVGKDCRDFATRAGWSTGEQIIFSEHGKRLFIKGDPRKLVFSDVNYADGIVNLLGGEREGFVRIIIRHHYFPSVYSSEGRYEKHMERIGWMLDIEFNGDYVGNYIKHIFSSPGITARTGVFGFYKPVVPLSEVKKFIPATVPLDRGKGVAIGKTVTRGEVFIDFQRDPHAMITGSSGSGKSTMIVGMMERILSEKLGKVILIDPHGDTARKVSEFEGRKFIVSPDSGVSINLIGSKRETTYRVSEEFVSILRSLREMQYSDPLVGPRMEDIISRGINILARSGEMTLVDFYNILREENIREDLISSSDDETLRKFLSEIGRMTEEEKISTERAIGRLVNDPVIRSFICNPRDSGILSSALSSNDLIIFDLDRGILGYEDSRLLSNIFALLIWFEISSSREGDYYLFLEEAHDYQSDIIADMLSSGRKFGLHVIFVTTSFTAISQKIYPLLASNVSNYIFMRLTDPDMLKIKEFLGRELDIPREPLEFIYVSPDGSEKGYVNRIYFTKSSRSFIPREFHFVTEQNHDEISSRIREIFTGMDGCSFTYFVIEEFVIYLGGTRRREIVSSVKEEIGKNEKIRYVGRVNIKGEKLRGRYECFLYSGSGEDCSGLPDEFRVTSNLISSLIERK